MRIYIFRTRSHECIDSWPLWAFISAITQCLLALRHQSRSYQNNNDKQFSATNSNHYFQCTRLSSRTMPRYFVRLKRAKQKLLFSLGLSFCLVWFSAWCPPPKQQQKSSKKKTIIHPLRITRPTIWKCASKTYVRRMRDRLRSTTSKSSPQSFRRLTIFQPHCSSYQATPMFALPKHF